MCYYGTKASGDDGFFTEENGYGNLSAGARFILVHLAASYANGSGDAFSGANSTAQNLALPKIIQPIRFQQVLETRIWLWYLEKAWTMRNMWTLKYPGLNLQL